MKTLKIGTWLGAALAAMLLASGPVRAGSDSSDLIRQLSVSDGTGVELEVSKERKPGRGVEGRAGKDSAAQAARRDSELTRDLSVTDGGPYRWN